MAIYVRYRARCRVKQPKSKGVYQVDSLSECETVRVHGYGIRLSMAHHLDSPG